MTVDKPKHPVVLFIKSSNLEEMPLDIEVEVENLKEYAKDSIAGRKVMVSAIDEAISKAMDKAAFWDVKVNQFLQELSVLCTKYRIIIYSAQYETLGVRDVSGTKTVSAYNLGDGTIEITEI